MVPLGRDLVGRAGRIRLAEALRHEACDVRTTGSAATSRHSPILFRFPCLPVTQGLPVHPSSSGFDASMAIRTIRNRSALSNGFRRNACFCLSDRSKLTAVDA